jgi:branched-subunit amino acid ABC-type transport system permease component
MKERGSSPEVPEYSPWLSRRTLRIAFPLILVAILVVISSILFGRDGLQSAINGVVDSSVLIPGAIGLSLLYGIRKFANFGHGELMTLGGYTAFLINVQLALPLYLGFIAAPFALAAVGIILELLIFSKLEGRGGIPPLVASIGLSLFLQNLVSALWGTDIESYRYQSLANWVGFGGLTLNPIKGALTIFLAVLFMVVVHALLTRTTLGKAMRATADNMDLARTTGIRTRYVIIWTWVLSSALAGVGGILIGIARDVRPTMGFDLLLLIFAAVILGGIGSAYGAMLGSLVIGLATDMSIPYLQWLDTNAGLVKGANYSPAIAFIIMVIVLLVRPEGILGVRRERGGTGAIRWLLARLKRRAQAPSEPKPGGD